MNNTRTLREKKHKIKKLCYISSIESINPKKSIGMINEHHSWDDTKLYTFYAFSKYAAEKEVWRGSQEGLNVVIVNPGLILGGKFNNSSMKKMLKIARSNFIFYSTGNIAIIDINDVVKILLLLMDSNITNERFILVSDNIKQKKLLNMLKLSVEKKIQIKSKLNSAKPFVTGTVIDSGIEKIKFEFVPTPLQTMPAFNVSVEVSTNPLTLNDTLALAALLDLGTYPMFLASETTFSRSVAESRKHSFAAILVLYAVM